MKLLFFAPFIFALCCTSVVSAQIEVEKSNKSSDNKKVKVFSEEQDYFDDGGGNSQNKNMVKFDPALIAFGEVPLFYERRINDMFSIEVGAGPTVAHPLTVIFSDFFGLMDGSLEIYPEEATTELGLTYKIAPRFYPLADGDFEGPYLAPTYHYKDFRFNLPLTNGFGEPTGQGYPMKWRYHDFMAQGGYQYEVSDFFYIDTYVAVGIRRKSLDYIKSEYDSNTGDYTYAPSTFKKDGIGYAVGTKIGIRF